MKYKKHWWNTLFHILFYHLCCLVTEVCMYLLSEIFHCIFNKYCDHTALGPLFLFFLMVCMTTWIQYGAIHLATCDYIQCPIIQSWAYPPLIVLYSRECPRLRILWIIFIEHGFCSNYSIRPELILNLWCYCIQHLDSLLDPESSCHDPYHIHTEFKISHWFKRFSCSQAKMWQDSPLCEELCGQIVQQSKNNIS